MMPPRTSRAAFDVLVDQAGLPLTPEQRATIHAVWGAVEAWQESVRTPAPGVAPLSAAAASAEPAITFDAGTGDAETGA